MITLMTMTKSQETPRNPGKHDDSLVYIEMRPANFGSDKTDLFPRFFIRCQLTRSSASAAHLGCHLANDTDSNDYDLQIPAPFAVAGFHSDLDIQDDPTGCGARGVSLTYTITILPDDHQVDKISAAMPFGGFSMPTTLFFKDYYQTFLKGWIDGYNR
jgi:hypothetical protein